MSKADFQELSRFSASGKTFFFNRGKAKNGTEYLVVNALWGNGNQERVIIFPPHFLEFRKHLSQAIERLSSVSFSSSEPKPACESCGMPKRTWRCKSDLEETAWVLFCSECGAVQDQSREDAVGIVFPELQGGK